MLLIWGFRSSIARLATLLLQCGVCRTPAAHHVTKVRKWFTLFFIPVIPYKTVHFTTCTYCGADLEISAEEATRLEAAAAATSGLPNQGAIPPPPGYHPQQYQQPPQQYQRQPRWDDRPGQPQGWRQSGP